MDGFYRFAVFRCTACQRLRGKKADGFDAAGYTTAYLDGMIKGDTDSLASLSGTSAEDLTAAFDTGIDELVTSFFGSDDNTPGSTQISAQLRQDYTTFWKNAFADTKYDIKEAEEKDSSYQVTVETQQMQLYTAMEPVYNEKLADYLKITAWTAISTSRTSIL